MASRHLYRETKAALRVLRIEGVDFRRRGTVRARLQHAGQRGSLTPERVVEVVRAELYPEHVDSVALGDVRAEVTDAQQ